MPGRPVQGGRAAAIVEGRSGAAHDDPRRRAGMRRCRACVWVAAQAGGGAAATTVGGAAIDTPASRNDCRMANSSSLRTPPTSRGPPT